MASTTCPNCKCVVSNMYGSCPVCNYKFSTSSFNMQAEMQRRRDQFNNDMQQINNAKSLQQSTPTYSTPSKSNSSRKPKKERSFMGYVVIGVISFLISNSLSFGFEGFIIIAIILLFIF